VTTSQLDSTGAVAAAVTEPRERLRVGFVMELGLGHTTFFQALREAVDAAKDIEPVWMPIEFSGSWPLGWLPKVRHDIVLRAGMAARAALAAAERAQPFDLIFFHTQMPAVFCSGLMRRTPSVISIDATPSQFESLGRYYGLRRSAWSRVTSGPVRRGYRAAFRTAAHIVAFSQWAADSAVNEYGLAGDRVTAIRPGVNLGVWKPAPRRAAGPIRLLFVGGEFERKGGDLLLRWMASAGSSNCVLDVVTGANVPAQQGVRVHHDYGPNDPRLIELFQAADLFVLPTRADTASWVVMEAMAAGTAVLATRVGAVG
jgi:glycosyltransferase involved in cell wall biosynthesis